MSVKAGFLHDTQKLLLVHFSISIPVCFIYHLLITHNQQGIRGVMGVSRVGLVVFTAVRTCSSSSVRFSPSSLATLFRFLNEILPVSSSSNSLKAFRISSLESFSAWKQGRERVLWHPALPGPIVAKVQRRKRKTFKHAKNVPVMNTPSEIK